MRTFTRTVSPGWKGGNLAAGEKARGFFLLQLFDRRSWPQSLLYRALLALCLLFGEMRRPEVGPPLPRGLFAKRPAPFGHLLVVAGEQNLRNVAPLERPRPGDTADAPGARLRNSPRPGCPAAPARPAAAARRPRSPPAPPPRRRREPRRPRRPPRTRARRSPAGPPPRTGRRARSSPGPFDHSATRAWVRGRPRALIYKSGRPARSTLSSAPAMTSARITWPGPPPAGVSSRKPRLSLEKPRMSTVSSAHRPCSRQAEPISETPERPGKGLGKHGQHGGGEGHGGALACTGELALAARRDAFLRRTNRARFAAHDRRRRSRPRSRTSPRRWRSSRSR